LFDDIPDEEKMFLHDTVFNNDTMDLNEFFSFLHGFSPDSPEDYDKQYLHDGILLLHWYS